MQASDSGGGAGAGAREKMIEVAALDIAMKLQTKGQFDIEGIHLLYPVRQNFIYYMQFFFSIFVH